MTLQELKEAEDAIIRCVQAQSYGKEIRAINDIMKSDEAAVRKIEKRKKAQIKKTSSLHRLSPFVSQGILRVGGRLSKADVQEELPFVIAFTNA